MKVILTFIILCSLSLYLEAGMVSATNGKISQVSSYGSGAVTGDVLIKISNPVAGCEAGYYVPNNNEGKDELLSMALAAMYADSKVNINAYDSPRWQGSSANYCLVEGFHVKK
ncbi:MAG: hypothetical protein K6L81_14675 [Agarilytica sp.]